MFICTYMNICNIVLMYSYRSLENLIIHIIYYICMMCTIHVSDISSENLNKYMTKFCGRNVKWIFMKKIEFMQEFII